MCLHFRLDFFLQNPDVLCNGRGTCGCNFCECTDSMFTGTFCDVLVSCVTNTMKVREHLASLVTTNKAVLKR